MDDKIYITRATLEHHNHIMCNIERWIKLYERGNVTFTKDASLGYVADISEKGEHRRVIINFTYDL